MRLDVVDEIRLQSPAEEVELANRGDEGFVARHAELNALPAAVRVEVLLVVGVELTLVGLVDDEPLPANIVGSEVLAAVLGDEPVDDAEADLGLTGQIGHNLADVRVRGIEALEAGYDELGLAIDLRRFASLGIGGIGQRGLH